MKTSSVCSLLQGKATFDGVIRNGIVISLTLSLSRSVEVNQSLTVHHPHSHLKLNFQFNMLYWHENGNRDQRSIEIEIDRIRVPHSISALLLFLDVVGLGWLPHSWGRVWFPLTFKEFPCPILCLYFFFKALSHAQWLVVLLSTFYSVPIF